MRQRHGRPHQSEQPTADASASEELAKPLGFREQATRTGAVDRLRPLLLEIVFELLESRTCGQAPFSVAAAAAASRARQTNLQGVVEVTPTSFRSDAIAGLTAAGGR